MKKLFKILLTTTFFLVVAQVIAVEVTPKQKITGNEINRYIQNIHYDPIAVNDTLSLRIFKTFIKKIDNRKRFFLQTDIDYLNKYEFQIDDLINSGDEDAKYSFYSSTIDIYRERLGQIEKLYAEMLDQPFNYFIEEEIETNIDSLTYAKDFNELKEIWRKYLKYQTISKYFDLVEMKSKEAKKKEKEVVEGQKPNDIGIDKTNIKEDDEIDLSVKFLQNGKMISEIEKEAREKVKKSTKRLFKRLIEQKDDDMFTIYINAILSCYDPHTTYMPPAEKEDFDISMTGKLQGIGATLSEEDGYIKIVSIVHGSPSWRGKELEVEDLILKVAQGDNEPEDIQDMPLKDAVKLIRGKKGTEVRLTIKKPSGDIKVISIIRDIIVIEETYAKYAVINNLRLGEKFGYIFLPKFYRDFSDKSSRNATDDVKDALIKIQKYNVNGVILDLRNNGGGSLNDAIKIGGLFIEDGPIVQVNNKIRKTIYNDNDFNQIMYSGPLVILINQLSASASEIVAAALQDYNRAIIVGSTQSFGKGTVQNIVSLDRFLDRRLSFAKPLGSLKVTIQKFYRVNGGTTQYNGVKSDIVLPGMLDYIDIGEKEYDYSLSGDSLDPLEYSKFDDDISLQNRIAFESHNRVNKNEYFTLMTNRNKRLRSERKKSGYNLNINKMINRKQDSKKEAKIFKEDQVEHDYTEIIISSDDYKQNSEEEKEKEAYDDWISGLKKDVYIDEAMSIINDEISK